MLIIINFVKIHSLFMEAVVMHQTKMVSLDSLVQESHNYQLIQRERVVYLSALEESINLGPTPLDFPGQLLGFCR